MIAHKGDYKLFLPKSVMLGGLAMSIYHSSNMETINVIKYEAHKKNLLPMMYLI